MCSIFVSLAQSDMRAAMPISLHDRPAPSDISREGFQRGRRYASNLSDTECWTCHSRMNATIPDKAIAEEVSGLIERVTFRNEAKGFSMLRVKV